MIDFLEVKAKWGRVFATAEKDVVDKVDECEGGKHCKQNVNLHENYLHFSFDNIYIVKDYVLSTRL